MRIERPWGWYEDLVSGDGYKVKRLLVRSGRQLTAASSPPQRKPDLVSEMVPCSVMTWQDASVGVMLKIPCGAVHRARGGHRDLIILEVQQGPFCGRTTSSDCRMITAG